MEPDAVAVSPDGRLALVADSDDGTVTPVNLHTMRAGVHIKVGHQPDAVGIGGPRRETALVANLGDGTVTPVDLENMTAGRPIAVGTEPDGIAMSPNGDAAFVANLGSNSVTYVNMLTLHAGRPIALAIPPTGIATETSAGDASPLAWVTGGMSIVAVSFDQRRLVGRPVAVGHLQKPIASRTEAHPHGWQTAIHM